MWWNKTTGFLLILIQCVSKLLNVFNCFISISSGISVLLNSIPAEFTRFLHFSRIWHIDSIRGQPQIKMHWKAAIATEVDWHLVLHNGSLFFFPLAQSNDWSQKWGKIVISQHNWYKNSLRELFSPFVLQPAYDLSDIKSCCDKSSDGLVPSQVWEVSSVNR